MFKRLFLLSQLCILDSVIHPSPSTHVILSTSSSTSLCFTLSSPYFLHFLLLFFSASFQSYSSSSNPSLSSSASPRLLTPLYQSLFSSSSLTSSSSSHSSRSPPHTSSSPSSSRLRQPHERAEWQPVKQPVEGNRGPSTGRSFPSYAFSPFTVRPPTAPQSVPSVRSPARREPGPVRRQWPSFIVRSN